VQPLFETFAKNAVIPPLPVLFMNMILFYGCGFNYQHCIQITTAERINKEKLGFRTAKIVGKLQLICSLIALIYFRCFQQREQFVLHATRTRISFGQYDFLCYLRIFESTELSDVQKLGVSTLFNVA
jgi:hypothetical protein